jgi:hypothetical protein
MKYSRLVDASYVRDYVIHVAFKDGLEADIDISDQLWGEVFEPLKDKAYFQQFRFNPEIHTIVWPNEADLAPEFLYERAKQASNGIVT